MKTIFAVLGILLSAPLVAADKPDTTERLISNIQASLSGVKITGMEEISETGLFEVELEGRDRVYVTEDGNFLLTGQLLRLEPGAPVNISENRREKDRLSMIAQLDKRQLISYKADNAEADVFVFTDPTCGYCRRLHQQMSEYNKAGISVHYLAFPRGGMEAEAANYLSAIWCSETPQKAMDDAKLRQQVAASPSDCKAPIEQQMQLGYRFGVQGTPAIFDQQGRSMGGYLSPAALAKRLGL